MFARLSRTERGCLLEGRYTLKLSRSLKTPSQSNPHTIQSQCHIKAQCVALIDHLRPQWLRATGLCVPILSKVALTRDIPPISELARGLGSTLRLSLPTNHGHDFLVRDEVATRQTPNRVQAGLQARTDASPDLPS